MLSSLFIALLFTQAPAAKVSTPPVSTPVAAKAEPLPELTRVKVELLQTKAANLGLELQASDAYKAYKAAIDKLSTEMDAILQAEKAACFTVDQVAKTRTPIVGCKAGK